MYPPMVKFCWKGVFLMGFYHVAQICLNGHVITDTYDQYPEFRQNFCDKCSAKTITKCPSCNSNIRGDYDDIDMVFISAGMTSAPAYCYNCGNPYPWTEDKLDATKELLALDSKLSNEELEYLSSNLNSLLIDTPKTKLVATKFKLGLSKLGKESAMAIRDIIVEIASESAKKIILGS